MALLLKADPNARVEIGAHTDNSGTSADNLRLTALQAEAVRDYLVVQGVAYQQLLARGYGSTVPLTRNATPRAQAANRRIELRPICRTVSSWPGSLALRPVQGTIHRRQGHDGSGNVYFLPPLGMFRPVRALRCGA